jgi:peptide deformylase
VGIAKRLIVVQRFDKEDGPFEFYVNPRITAVSDSMVVGAEGCLSVPGRYGKVARHAEVTIEYLDGYDFTPHTERVGGYTAIIFQHEIDHLEGVLYIDKLADDNDDAEFVEP